MVKKIKFLDKIHLQKYIYLIKAFLLNKIQASVFEELFIQIRREDSYWLSSSFDEEVNNIMDSIFLDIDEFNPEELYDPSNKFNIDEKELKARLEDKLIMLNKLLEEC